MPTPRAEQLAQPVQMTMESIKAKGVKRLILGGAAALAAFGAVAATGIVSRARSEHEIAQWTEQQAIPTVAFVKLQQGAPVKDLILPGTIEAYYRAEALAYLHGIMGKPRPPQSRPCGGFQTSARTCAATSEAGNPAVNLRTMQKRRFEETAELFRFLGFYQQREDGQSGIAAAPVADQERSRS